jgi:hypothetical protein
MTYLEPDLHILMRDMAGMRDDIFPTGFAYLDKRYGWNAR